MVRRCSGDAGDPLGRDEDQITGFHRCVVDYREKKEDQTAKCGEMKKRLPKEPHQSLHVHGPFVVLDVSAISVL